MINSALGGSSSVRPVRHLFSARLQLRLERFTWLSPRAVRWFLTGLDAIRQVLLTLQTGRPLFAVFVPSTQLSARLRLTSNYHAPTEKALGMWRMALTPPSSLTTTATTSKRHGCSRSRFERR